MDQGSGSQDGGLEGDLEGGRDARLFGIRSAALTFILGKVVRHTLAIIRVGTKSDRYVGWDGAPSASANRFSRTGEYPSERRAPQRPCFGTYVVQC